MSLVALVAAVAALAAPGHVATIVLENRDYATTFGRHSHVPYLGRTLRRQGTLLANYYGIGHASLPNYLAMIAGVPPNRRTRADCPRFDCTYPPSVRTLPNQLESAGLRWRGYFQHIPTPCPAQETTRRRFLQAYQYVTRHDPFVYFRAITDRRADCRAHVVGLSHLGRDLASSARTPVWSLIVPDVCADGHDRACPDRSRPGGDAGVQRFLRRWVPRILRAPAFRRDGLLVITFDEAEHDDRHGGGRVGALLLGPAAARGATDRTPLDHYSYLRTMEDLFGLPHLGRAARDGVATFPTAGAITTASRRASRR